ncbi:MAG TPA: VCBS repeat-containing protein, partial [Bryobacteraceae bacterium]|nr:VCBS repeat-containing protein [Bryobacteraceae bacterium]
MLPAATAEEGQITVQAPEPAGAPILYQRELPADADADSLRVEAGDTDLPRKVEWQRPNVRVSWRSTGAGTYVLRFTRGAAGGRMHQPEPAMIGTGDRVTYGRPGVRGKLSVGLWAHPAAIDLDQDGATDLIVGCPDHPSNGIYYFRNLGTNRKPLFARGEWMGPGKKDLVVADFNGDGKPDLVVSGGYYSDIRANRLSRFVAVPVVRSYHVGRDDLWYPVDWDGDGRIDLLVGASDWREYGWDDAYNAKGEWTHGPLHGYVWFHRNVGTNEAPRYAEPVRLEAGGRVLDQYGSPAPNPVDWFGKGRLDLIAGSFLDTVTLYRNTGSRTAPQLAAGETLPFRMDICMIQPRVADWYGDGRVSLLVGEEDGRVSLVENTAGKGETPKLAPPRF